MLSDRTFNKRNFIPAELAVITFQNDTSEKSYNIQMVASQLNCQESVNDNFSLICDQHGDPTQGPTARSVDPMSWLRSEFDELSGENRPRITKKLIEQIKEQFNKSEQLIDRQKKDFAESQKDVKYWEKALSRCSSDDEGERQKNQLLQELSK